MYLELLHVWRSLEHAYMQRRFILFAMKAVYKLMVLDHEKRKKLMTKLTELNDGVYFVPELSVLDDFSANVVRIFALHEVE